MQIVSYGVTPEIRREHVISYSRNIHMNLCFKKKHKKTGWFSMCEVLKINTPTFSGHLTSLLLSFLPKSPKVYSFKDDQTCSSLELLIIDQRPFESMSFTFNLQKEKHV